MIAIVAMDQQGAIGKDNDLPWTLPNDLEWVRMMTSGHTIIMGRKNHESIGRALPGRRNIVLTRDKGYTSEGCEIANTVEEVLAMTSTDKVVFVFGGTEIYELFLPHTKELLVTWIEHTFPDCDTFFPTIDWSDWQEVWSSRGIVDEKNKYAHTFHRYVRADSTQS